jgi:hydroxyacylglutathione hydrolase
MMASLQILAALPVSTQVYCTHEYTLHNINFALSLEPTNKALIKRQRDATELIKLGLPTLPSTIALELATNPFLRSDVVEIQSALLLEKPTELQTFTKTRELRNSY